MDVEEFVGIGKREGWVNETTNVNTVQIGGTNVECKVYEVRIDHLHYNTQNGRISTFVSRYRAEHGKLPQDPAERDCVIQRMIDQDNHPRLMKTKLDIEQKGQQEVALILTNGTVIDGNRRFTCLRMLSAEEAAPRYLRCYIFPDTYDERAIKGLELEIQLGKDEKVHYDPIARLVDINEWVNSGRMSSEEYRAHAGMSKNDMATALAQIDLIDEFLEIIEAPGAYQIAQDLMVDAPFKDLANKLNLKVDRGFIVTDEHMLTSLNNVYAIGDCTSRIMLAHTAHKNAMVAVDTILGKPNKYVPLKVPSCIYTHPEVASIGYTEEELIAKNIPYYKVKTPMSHIGKALADGSQVGFIKLMVDKTTGEILGCHIIASTASDIIAEIALTMESELTVYELANTIHPHPTISEAI